MASIVSLINKISTNDTLFREKIELRLSPLLHSLGHTSHYKIDVIIYTYSLCLSCPFRDLKSKINGTRIRK